MTSNRKGGRVRFLPTVVLALLLSTASHCFMACANADPVTINTELSKNSMHPGEPLELVLHVTRTDESPDLRIEFAELTTTRTTIRIIDAADRVTCSSIGQPPLIGGLGEARDMIHFDLREEHSATVARSFQEWCSTELPTGSYRVLCIIHGARLLVESPSGRRNYMELGANESEFPLEVVERDDEHVRESYKHWLESAVAGAEGRSSLAPDSPTEHAFEMIVYAKTLLALPYQLDLLRHDYPLRFNHIFDLASHLIARPTADLASELLDILNIEDIGHPWKREVISWAVFKLHETGDPEIVEVTREYVQTHKRPRDPNVGAPF